MIVVADTAPLHYLILIGHAETLAKLYGRVIIPEAVADELRHSKAPKLVQSWMMNPPTWVEIQKVRDLTSDATLKSLDKGEREAILLALELHAQLLLIDERAGRKAAQRCSLQVAGPLAVLEDAARRDMLDFPQALKRLQKTNFRLSADILKFFSARNPSKKR